MKLRFARSLFLLWFLPFIPACDPHYDLCVVVISCLSTLPIEGAHVRIRAYDVDGNTSADGKICERRLNFPDPFQIEVDAAGYLAKTEGPFQFDKPGTTGFQATVCLTPQP